MTKCFISNKIFGPWSLVNSLFWSRTFQFPVRTPSTYCYRLGFGSGGQVLRLSTKLCHAMIHCELELLMIQKKMMTTNMMEEAEER